jgi:4-diphosphocytidyl-2-C-methyl-D-erythritol kinase
VTPAAVKVRAQAKINLHLRVLAREVSGYHSIETIFHRIDLADELIVSAVESGRTLDVAGDDLGKVESNLAYRAAIAYQALAGWPAGFRIELTKKIPLGAGLGGGSADAAAVLRGLNSFAPSPLDESALLHLATGLGADVPFLTSDAVMALAWGRGERMLSLPALPHRHVVLVTPEFRVVTADAYAWLDANRSLQDASTSTTSRRDPNAIFSRESLSSWRAIAEMSVNDFLDPVVLRHPQIGELIESLSGTGPLLLSMSGSGSTVFSVYETLPEIMPIADLQNVIIGYSGTADKVVQPIRMG